MRTPGPSTPSIEGRYTSVLAQALRHSLAHLDGLGDRPVSTSVSKEELRQRLDRPLADEGLDPTRVIIPLAQEHGAWVHFDGAFGLWAHTSPRFRGLLEGAESADSWTVDGHKWLNVPFDCGYAFVADPEAHRGSMAQQASYLVVDGECAGPSRPLALLWQLPASPSSPQGLEPTRSRLRPPAPNLLSQTRSHHLEQPRHKAFDSRPYRRHVAAGAQIDRSRRLRPNPLEG